MLAETALPPSSLRLVLVIVGLGVWHLTHAPGRTMVRPSRKLARGWPTRLEPMTIDLWFQNPLTPAVVTESDVVETFAKAAVQVEAKTPTGPQLDMVTLMPMLNPKLMPVPTMLIHGEYDDVADFDGLLPFFQQLPNPYKRYVVIPNAGHMMHLQGGHRLFQHEVVSFFKEP